MERDRLSLFTYTNGILYSVREFLVVLVAQNIIFLVYLRYIPYKINIVGSDLITRFYLYIIKHDNYISNGIG